MAPPLIIDNHDGETMELMGTPHPTENKVTITNSPPNYY